MKKLVKGIVEFRQNVLQQLEHLRSYPIVKERLANKQIKLHGW